jgi:protein-S-isoprenylcysteine O-methyltransferase Ste14
MRRWSFFIYGVISHLLFLAVYAWLAAFVGNWWVPNSLDSPPEGNLGSAIAIDLGLIGLFALQHSVMARPWFKRRWTKIVPEPIERSTYSLCSSSVLILLMWQWRGLGVTIWDVQQPVARGLLWGLFTTGWLLVPLVTLMINHFDLFGTRQVWLHLQGKPYTSLPFRTPYLYAHMRHPLYVGWTIAFWATPTMTLSHLIFAIALTLYMVVVVVLWEERDLVTYFGDEYRAYQQRVPMFLPRFGRRAATTDALPANAKLNAAEQTRQAV